MMTGPQNEGRSRDTAKPGRTPVRLGDEGRMSDRETALFANAAFYAAFGTRDIKAMEDVWSRDQPVSCIHPGWPVVHGRTEVMASWSGILANRNAPRIVCRAD